MKIKRILFIIAVGLLMSGGLLTHFTAQKEEFHLRIGEINHLGAPLNLSLQLTDFQIINNNQVINFSAFLHVHDVNGYWKGEVRANRMLWHQGNRIFLKAADKDLGGCTLLVTRDPAGLGFVYAAYLIFTIFIMGFFASPNCQFRQLLQSEGASFKNSKYQCAAFISTVMFTLTILGLIIFRYFFRGHNPFSNLFDSLLLFALGITIVGIFVCRRSTMLAFLSLPMAGFAILAGFMTGGSTASPTQAILNSSWLPIHVSFIMMAYSLFAFTLLTSIICIFFIFRNINKEKVRHLTQISQICGLWGEGLLAIGIMVGSIWASMSWGSYWDWDPKETCALLTLLAYGIVLAISFGSKSKTRPLTYHLLMLIPFCLLLMTYFGVNVWFGGKHAY